MYPITFKMCRHLATDSPTKCNWSVTRVLGE